MDRSAYLHDPTRYAAGSQLEALTLAEAFARTAARMPHATAAIDGERNLTWGELDRHVRTLGACLRERGIGRGDVVGLSFRNSWEFVAAHVAIARVGAVTLGLHVAYGDHELMTLLQRTGARALFLEGRPASDESLKERFSTCPWLHTILTRATLDAVLASERDGPAAPGVVPADPFALVPTSGTESRVPKICMHSHEGLLSNAAQVARDAGIDERDVLFPASGFTHLFGLLGVHISILTGATLVGLAKFDGSECLRIYGRSGVTLAWAVPAQLVDIVAAADGIALPALREVRTAGAALPPALAQSVAEKLGVAPTAHWGMSEIGAGITTRSGDSSGAAATIGLPLAGAMVRIVDAESRPCGVDEAGELHYRRSDMFRGYYDEPELTAGSLTEDGFLRTGDLASIDARGRVHFHGRLKDLINRGGMKISALELESLLAAMPALGQLAVVRVDDARLGERVALVCALKAGASVTLDDVRAHLSAHGIAKYKWPESLVVVDALPLTPTGKIAKEAVRALAAEATAGGIAAPAKARS